MGPVTVPAFPRSWDSLSCWSPVPALLDQGLQVFPVTPLEIALPSSSPDVVKILFLDEVCHPVTLLLGLDGDGVHAELPAVVPGPLPVPLGAGPSLQPGEVISLPKPLSVNDS